MMWLDSSTVETVKSKTFFANSSYVLLFSIFEAMRQLCANSATERKTMKLELLAIAMALTGALAYMSVGKDILEQAEDLVVPITGSAFPILGDDNTKKSVHFTVWADHKERLILPLKMQRRKIFFGLS
ncbi:hypothetical protein RRG08_007213 [Elysia crispata]|uniref:Uncharacterized protein n=1 Tax=Elysia crispata TaxID=231223 RepID=A0AAE1A8M9_9GAST|nr:hypothetical protein RRG08_007213 [Elysia crispata]